MGFGGWVLTHAGSLEASGEEERGEAEEGSHAGGLLAAAPAVLDEDVDLGRLEAQAGVDPHHAAGPAGRTPGWDRGTLASPFSTPFPSFLWMVGKSPLQAESISAGHSHPLSQEPQGALQTLINI